MTSINHVVPDGSLRKLSSKIQVFVCGGGRKAPADLASDAYEVGALLAKTNVAYGQGGAIAPGTIMGETWLGYHNNGGKSAYFFVRKVGAPDLSGAMTNLEGFYYVDDIADLVKAQFFFSDIVIIMPGGTGTDVECSSYIEMGYDWEEIKPTVILYNKKMADGRHFFDGKSLQMETSLQYGFVSNNVIENNFIVVDNIDDLKKAYIAALEEKRKKHGQHI